MSYFVLGFRSYFINIINRTFHSFFIHNDFEYIHFFAKHALHSVVCVKCLSLVFYLIPFFFYFSPRTSCFSGVRINRFAIVHMPYH